MSLFTKPKTVFWPKKNSLEIYFDKKEQNHFTFDINLWEEISESNLTVLKNFFNQNKIKQVDLLVPNRVAVNKSFIYDSKIDSIDKNELVALAKDTVEFKIYPDFLTSKLFNRGEKTIIQTTIYDKSKLLVLRNNLSRLQLKLKKIISISSAISSLISSFYQKKYFLIYQTDISEFLCLLAKNKSVYLSVSIKNISAEIQKNINYSKLYFSSTVDKLFLPKNLDTKDTPLDNFEKTILQESKISQDFKKATNFPLPIVPFFVKKFTFDKTGIIKHMLEDNPTIQTVNDSPKKNTTSIILVFIATISIVSAILWILLNKNSEKNSESLSPNQEDENRLSPSPTLLITPTPETKQVEVDKESKIQVLNATEINGQAATLKKDLVELGFDNIAVGNSNDELTVNTVNYKKSLGEISNYFISNLASFSTADFNDSLDEDSTYDMVFIIATDLSKSNQDIDEDITEAETETETETPILTPTESADLIE
ncbi:LytR C-terminal domain-containing protein [Patescibacteria group bacterium]|nr:LytR C-terminal domain-containing protein [Patescibacteria group bacterium]